MFTLAVSLIHAVLEQRLVSVEEIQRIMLRNALSAAGVSLPSALPPLNGNSPKLNHELQLTLSELVATAGLSLVGFIRLWRNKTTEDKRPNKALDPGPLRYLLVGYKHAGVVVKVSSNGVFQEFTAPPSTTVPLRNRKSAQQLAGTLIKNIRAQQDNGTYLVVTSAAARSWSDIQYCPFECVPKKGTPPPPHPPAPLSDSSMTSRYQSTRLTTRLLHRISSLHSASTKCESERPNR
ncbi:hypothetical protein PybrP1_000985 [[Pythium] brassicae (nom. inval.)]|nr:hypothetical protein PybrP1_000985 [[Pythium] brassicae (nom. inval.)]